MTEQINQVIIVKGREELEQAYELLRAAGEPVNKHHALPSTVVLAVKRGAEIIAAATLYGESAFLLPLEASFPLREFREQCLGRIAELGTVAVREGLRNQGDIKRALFHYATCFSSSFCHYEYLLLTSGPENSGWLKDTFGFQYLAGEKSMELLVLPLSQAKDARYGLKEQYQFQYPEKRFFLVNHQVLTPELLDYFFNKRHRIFDSLSDAELRVLKNIYDFGEYAHTLPQRSSMQQYKRVPKAKRFEMSCDGYLTQPGKGRIHFQVVDVSDGGLRLCTEETLEPGAVYALHISIGVMKNTEVIARAVWVNEDSRHVGLEVKSSDKSWKRLIRYLEDEFHRYAA